MTDKQLSLHRSALGLAQDVVRSLERMSLYEFATDGRNPPDADELEYAEARAQDLLSEIEGLKKPEVGA